jgi:hypothetical protein
MNCGDLILQIFFTCRYRRTAKLEPLCPQNSHSIRVKEDCHLEYHIRSRQLIFSMVEFVVGRLVLQPLNSVNHPQPAPMHWAGPFVYMQWYAHMG